MITLNIICSPQTFKAIIVSIIMIIVFKVNVNAQNK